MLKISNEQIAFIDHDLTARGIVLEELRDNLIDHICCIIENESQQNEDFFKCYDRVLPQFFKEELQEIQTETDYLLKIKNFYTMKKIMNISGISTVFLILVGAILKTLHLPGAAITFILGGFTFAFLFLPILIIIKFKDDESITEKLVFSLGLVLAMAISVGVIFKIMHWPFANILMFSGTIIFSLLYVPLYFFTRIRTAEKKFNTIVNSVIMLAFGGILYSLFDLSYSKKYESQMQEIHYYLHDNSIRLFKTNNDLYTALPLNSQSKNLRNSTSVLNNKLEVLVELIVKNKNTKGLNIALNEMLSVADDYNAQLKLIGNSNLRVLNIADISIIDQLNPELAMQLLARVQQQIAVNENVYLSKQVAAN